ncbi:AcidPPc domain-containing protein [Aphelenchoides bicaudatus]|nr:AcidPPc domain-containing protein [Aphelenchoides bicaudatus]
MVSKHIFSTLISIPILLILKVLTNKLPYTRQGFFCDDDDIRHPFREDTVNSRLMTLGFNITGSVLIVTSEWWLIRHLTRKGRRLIVDRQLHPIILNFIFLLSSYICADLASTVSNTVAKKIISRLRPNFLAVCQPNLTLLCPPGSHEFIENYTCNNVFYDDEYLSFPSGHSSSTAVFAVFFIYYLHKRCKFHEVVRSFIQYAIFLCAIFIMSTRISDYKHRLADVLGGACLGGFFALFFVTHVMKSFKANRYEIRDGDYDEDDPQDGPIQAHINQPIYPTIVINKHTKPGTSSEYGSLSDSDKAKSYEQI